jgi:hypothetical protein
LAPAVLTVRANDQTRPYGTSNAPLTVTYSGFIGGDGLDVLSGSPALSTLAETNSPIGDYPIEVSQGSLSNACYTFSFINGMLTVTPGVLTVTAESQTRPYGAANVPLTLSYSGLVNGQDSNILSGSAILGTTAETNSPVGEYAIMLSQGTLGVTDTNYTFAFVSGTLTIFPASTTVALISSQNPSTNGSNASFTATVSPVAPATAIPTGSVTFRMNGVLLATVGLSGGQGSIFTELLPPGPNVVQVEYAGDGNFLGSTDSVQQMVEPVPTPPCSSTNYVLSLTQTTGNNFTITLLGTTNAQYYLLTATDLAVPMTNWTVLADSTNTATNGVWYYTGTAGMLGDNSTSGVVRFFRAKAVNPCP